MPGLGSRIVITMRKPLIVANWKMNNTVSEALHFVAAFTTDLKATGSVDVAIAPPFTALYSLSVALADTEFKLAAQDVFWEESGAYTGEITSGMLKEVGCTYVIIGHSERRHLFGETDKSVNLRAKAVFKAGLTPIMCVGETSQERDANKTLDVIEKQVRRGVDEIDLGVTSDFAIAYEPVWAIGTGRNASPDQAQEVHGLIRHLLRGMYSPEVADRVRIIYGGSVKPSNSRDIVSMPDIDGALVGGASLDPKQFAAIVRSAH